MKKEIAELLSKFFGNKLDKSSIENVIEIPPKDFGDYSFPCFFLSKIENNNPEKIASEIFEKIKNNKPPFISRVEVRGAYLNFFLDWVYLAKEILKKAIKEDYGKSKEGKNKKIVIDFSSPNVAKPFGIGHLRSTIIGNSLGNIFSFLGYKVIRINYLGDWGTQFGKLIFAYKKWGNKKELDKNPIMHLFELYIKANDSIYEEEAREEFRKLENGDKQNVFLWKKFREISLKEFNKIYSFFDVKFDIISGESFYVEKSKRILKELKEKNLLKESEGALIVDLNNFDLGVCLIKKADGTTLYSTRDIIAAVDRFEKYNFDKMIYEVGQEQKLHFKQIFKILELLGYDFYRKCFHVSHGLYLDKDGKKLSTRKGKTFLMGDLINETVSLAKDKILKRGVNYSDAIVQERAEKVALAAIIYGDLKNHREIDMVFDIEKFLEFEGNTGPYLLYSYARASSIQKKIKKKKFEFNVKKLNMHEIDLIKKISIFPEVVKNSADKFSPNILANYSFELCQSFNEFYHSSQVIGSKEEDLRLFLVEVFRRVLKKCLNLLGIKEIDEM